MPYPTGPGTPIIAGVGDMSVDEFLVDPLVITKTIQDMPGGYFLADTLFRTDTSPSGAVIYNQLTDLDLYINTDPARQPQDVNPGDEFPAVGAVDRASNVALIKKNGGYFNVTDEEKRHDRRDPVSIKLRRLKNTLVQISNAKLIYAILNDPTILANCTTSAAALWTDNAAKPLTDISQAINTVDNGNDLGYTTDVGLIHPDAAEVLQEYLDASNKLPRESRTDNPVFNKQISGVKNLNWIVNRRFPRTSVIVAQAKMPGVMVSEIPPFTEVIPERKNMRDRVQSGRMEQPVITDPYSVHVITGVIAA